MRIAIIKYSGYGADGRQHGPHSCTHPIGGKQPLQQCTHVAAQCVIFRHVARGICLRAGHAAAQCAIFPHVARRICLRAGHGSESAVVRHRLSGSGRSPPEKNDTANQTKVKDCYLRRPAEGSVVLSVPRLGDDSKCWPQEAWCCAPSRPSC